MRMSIHRFRVVGTCLVLVAGLFGAACGDVGSVQVELEFPDPTVERDTNALLYRAREVPTGRSGCDDLWGGQPADLKQKEMVVEYPHPTDIRALGIDLGLYDALTFFVYAFPSVDSDFSNPCANALAGGCTEAPVSGDSTSSIVVQLKFPECR